MSLENGNACKTINIKTPNRRLLNLKQMKVKRTLAAARCKCNGNILSAQDVDSDRK